MRFLRPEFLYSFIPIFIVSGYLFLKLKQGFRIRKKWESSRLGDISRFSSKGKKILVYCLMILMVSLVVLALSRPQISYEKPIKKPFDILCFVDESWSMRTMDVLWQEKKVFRLDLVKEELRSFIKNYIGKEKSQLALVVFGSKAIPRIYFTFGTGSLLSYIDHLDTKDFPPEGTDIGEAILTGLDMLYTIDSKPDVFGYRKNRRVFILISDGEDLGEILDWAIVEVQQKRIPIYTIGVGSQGGGYIVEEIDEHGNVIYMIDEDTGERVFSKLEEETLKKIARATGGKYARSQTGEELTKAFKEVLEREAEKEKETEKAYRDIYYYLFGAAFVLCLLIIILYI